MKESKENSQHEEGKGNRRQRKIETLRVETDEEVR